MTDEYQKYPFMKFDPLKLNISRDLVGASLEFELRDHLLRFELPTPANPKVLSLVHEDEFDRLRRSMFNEDLYINGAFPEGDMRRPAFFLVQKVKLAFLKCPEFERYRITPESEYNQGQLIGYLKSEVGKQAIDLWLRTLRWKSGYTSIGRSNAVMPTAADTAQVYVPPVDGKGAWGPRGPIRLPPVVVGDGINMEIWKATEQSLQNGEEPPLAFDLFANASYLAVLNDYRRAFLELAMAAEVHIRTRNEDKLPSSLDAHVKKEIRGLSYRKHLELFFKQLGEKGKKVLTGHGGIKTSLESLLEDRNVIAHHGIHRGSATTDKEVELSRKQFSIYRDAVKRLLEH